MARITSTQDADLVALKKSVEVGYSSARLSVGAEILSRCASRFVYLDGSDGVPNSWGEYIGMGLAGVEHSVHVREAAADVLVLELQPGKRPDREHEVARLQKLLNEADAALLTHPSDKLLHEIRGRFVAAISQLANTP